MSSTHDSIGLGEDGPTHQAVEHVPSLRLIPQLDVWRPADTIETAVAWGSALQRRDGPAALALSRQVLPVVATPAQAEAIARGGYVLADVPAGQTARAVIIGTGSELQFALQAQSLLAAEAWRCAWCRCPAPTSSTASRPAYQSQVLPRALPAVAVDGCAARLLAQVRRPRGWRRGHCQLR